MKTTKEEQEDANKRFDELLKEKSDIYGEADRKVFILGWVLAENELLKLNNIMKNFFEEQNIITYSTIKAIEIQNKYRDTKGLYEKFKYMKSCEGVEMVIKDKRFWFEFYGKRITATDFYIGSGLKVITNLIFEK